MTTLQQLLDMADTTGEEIKAHPDQWKGHMTDLGVDAENALDWAPAAVHIAHRGANIPPEAWLLIGVHYGLVFAREIAAAPAQEREAA